MSDKKEMSEEVMSEKIKEFIKLDSELESMKRELGGKIGDLLLKEMREKAKPFFDKITDLEGISVNGYTPYFNDGEPCEFSINEPQYKLKDMDEYDWLWSSDEAFNKAITEVFDTVFCYPDALFQLAFDDHFEVIITRDNAVVEEYDHD